MACPSRASAQNKRYKRLQIVYTTEYVSDFYRIVELWQRKNIKTIPLSIRSYSWVVLSFWCWSVVIYQFDETHLSL